MKMKKSVKILQIKEEFQTIKKKGKNNLKE
jgi:hypothetical protein